MSDESVVFHYRPDLFLALIRAIDLLHKGKYGILNFFIGAGVPQSLMANEQAQVCRDRTQIRKAEIATNILKRLNEQGNKPDAIRQRREIARRVCEWEDFSSAWPEKELAAKGAVQEVRRLINVYDSFTRMQQALDKESKSHREKQDAAAAQREEAAAEFASLKKDFYSLFDDSANPQKRGKALEGVLNRFFRHAQIGIREAFTVICDETGKPLEQIDGVIEINHCPYLVEMKWEKDPIGVPAINQHLSRIFIRRNSGNIRGMYISYSGYTAPAITTVKTAKVSGAFVFLCTIFDLFRLFECEGDLKMFCEKRITAAELDNPWLRE